MNPTFKDLVNHFCQDVRFVDDTTAFIRCPGHHRHTTPTHDNHTKIWVDGDGLRLKCFHASCQQERAKLFREMGPAIELYVLGHSPELLEAKRLVREKEEEVKTRYRAVAERVIKENAWPLNLISTVNPMAHDMEHTNQWALFLSMFDARDRIWTGEPGSSGQLHHIRNFQTVNEWWNSSPRGRFTCPATFKPGTRSRAVSNVLRVPYLVVEGDALVGKTETPEQKNANKDACGAIFNFLRKEFGLKLKAVVNTGNKSLHGWFVHPGEEAMETLRLVIPALGCDKALLNPSQPVRLPGMLREAGGAMQEFIYFDPQIPCPTSQQPHPGAEITASGNRAGHVPAG